MTDDFRTPLLADESEPVQSSDSKQSEKPRFAGGFHDVLITLGAVILLVGLGGLAHPALALAATLALSEVLLRHLRLALPAIALPIAFAVTVYKLISTLVISFEIAGWDGLSWFLSDFQALFHVVFLASYVFRYRVPLAHALTIYALGVCLAQLVSAVINLAVHGEPYSQGFSVVATASSLVVSLAMFVYALRLDLSDPYRVTSRSDTAFWLHLGIAPTLLYTTFYLMFAKAKNDDMFFGIVALSTAGPVRVLLIVGCFVLLGVLIDRRAFVTSGLIALGYAVSQLMGSDRNMSASSFSAILSIVGVFVLVIGVLWTPLRNAILRALPVAVQSRLPPMR